MLQFRTIVVLALTLALSGGGSALAWDAPFFDKDASGAPTYEEMAISPQAVYDPANLRTYVVYQGYMMDPYVVSYDHATKRWRGPYRIGANTLGTNTHGAPALVVDSEGYLVAFWGGHLGQLSHARSKRPGDVARWDDLGSVRVGSAETTINATYPQAALDASGTITLVYRRDAGSPTRGDWEAIVSTTTPSGRLGWTEPEMLLDGSMYNRNDPTSGSYWYANVAHDDGGGLALAAVRRDWVEGPNSADFRIRKGVYYLERSRDETWTSAFGTPIEYPFGFPSLEVTAAVRPEGDGYYTNQVVVRRDKDGRPGVLYLAGTHSGGVYEWRFARLDGDEWDDALITTTDNFFDAGTFEFMPDGTVEAFLTTGGVADDQWRDDPTTVPDEGLAATRGGDISYWRSDDGESWTKVRDLITSPGAHARYNNPQIVNGHSDGARLIFSEWNNDAANFIHKVFLWGDDGFVQRSFTPEVHRLAGDSRITTAVEISKQGFPMGATTAVIAAAHDFPDVLCGVPLAQTLKAPVLLTRQGSLDPALAEELLRLNVSDVVILGGEKAVSTNEVELKIRQLVNAQGRKLRTTRIQGVDRYETSAKIARRIVELRGAPERVVLASGEAFADALAVSPYAARKGYPVLLTPASRVSSATAGVIQELAETSSLSGITVVGGTAAVSQEVVEWYERSAAVYRGERWGGADRYETAAVIARHAMDAGHTLERFAVATGQNFADAVGGGLFMARVNGVVLTTPSTLLHPAVEALLEERAFSPGTGVLDVYVLGGPVAVAPAVADALSMRLHYLDGNPLR